MSLWRALDSPTVQRFINAITLIGIAGGVGLWVWDKIGAIAGWVGVLIAILAAISATFIAIGVGYYVLSFVRSRGWLGAPVRNVFHKELGGSLGFSGTLETKHVRGAPNQQSSPAQYGRMLLPSTVTPEYLINLRRENLQAQADGLVKPFLGRWINVAEPVHDVMPDNEGITQVALSRGPVVTVYLEFETAKWGAHLALLKKGQVLSASGFLTEVTALWVRLKDCEIPL